MEIIQMLGLGTYAKKSAKKLQSSSLNKDLRC